MVLLLTIRLLHLLLVLGRRAESTGLRLAWLHLLWCSEGIKWVLPHWSLHTWLISVHSHGHALSTHVHAPHVVVQGSHCNLMAHSVLLHTTHTLHSTHHLLLLASHWLEWHGLEPSLCSWLLYRAESVCIWLLLGTTSHHIGERVRTWQLLLCLELVWLLVTWLLLRGLVEALKQ